MPNPLLPSTPWLGKPGPVMTAWPSLATRQQVEGSLLGGGPTGTCLTKIKPRGDIKRHPVHHRARSTGKTEPVEGEQALKSHMSDKASLSRAYRELQELSNGKPKSPAGMKLAERPSSKMLCSRRLGIADGRGKANRSHSAAPQHLVGWSRSLGCSFLFTDLAAPGLSCACGI